LPRCARWQRRRQPGSDPRCRVGISSLALDFSRDVSDEWSPETLLKE
jgi:hypothetical protein